MKEYIIKEDFKLRQIGENYIVVALGKTSKVFNGMITLNESGAFLWKTLKEVKTKEALLSAFTSEYDVDIDTAKKDIDNFVGKLEENGIFE